MTDGVHIRLTLTRGVKITSGMDPRLNQSGPTLIVLAEHKPPVYDTRRPHADHQQRPPVRRPTASTRRSTTTTCCQSILAKIEANAAGADDALMLDTRGFVAETNATHVFLVERGVVLTPPHRRLPRRDHARRGAGAVPRRTASRTRRDLSLTEVYRADEVFCTGTMGELAAVTTIDGRTIGDGRVGPMTQRLTELFRELTRAKATPVA